MTTLEVMQGLVGKALIEVKETPLGIFLTFEGGVVLWWKR